MFEVNNANSDIVFINKIIDVFGRSPTSIDINIDTTLLNRFTTNITGNRNGEWTVHETSVYPGESSPVKKYKYHNGKWYELEENEEFKEIN